MHSCFHFFLAGALRSVAPAGQRFGRRGRCYRRGARLGLRPVLPRPAGQVRAVARFKPGFLGQTQASPARHIRTMIVKSVTLLSFFVRGFALLCCTARRGTNCSRRFRRNRFTNCRPTLSLEPRDIVRVQTLPPAAAYRRCGLGCGGPACMANPISLFEPRLHHQLNHAAFHENRPILC